jgi:hypothetical protein
MWGGGGKGGDRLRDILATGEWESQGILNICHIGGKGVGRGGEGRGVREKKLGFTDTLGKRGTLEGGIRWRERSEERPRRMDMN